jgi:hypothetical protein
MVSRVYGVETLLIPVVLGTEVAASHMHGFWEKAFCKIPSRLQAALPSTFSETRQQHLLTATSKGKSKMQTIRQQHSQEKLMRELLAA